MKWKAVFCAVLLVFQYGCAPMPKTRAEYIDLHNHYAGVMKAHLYNEQINSGNPFDKTVLNVEQQIKKCISTEAMTRRDNISGGWTANRYEYSTESVSNDKYEVTIRNHTGAGLLFIIVADFARNPDGTADVQIYSQKNFDESTDAFVAWVKGDRECHKFTG